MKTPQNIQIIPQWEPDQQFAVPLHRHAPMARRAPDFLPEAFFQLEEGTWRISAPLQ